MRYNYTYQQENTKQKCKDSLWRQHNRYLILNIAIDQQGETAD
jgi:hypothetical protein